MTSIATDDVMAEVAARVRRSVLAAQAMAGEGSDLSTEDIAAAAALIERALEGRRQLLLTPFVLDDDDWMLSTSLRFESHRPVIGRAIVAVKRRVLLPMLRWLFEYSRDNLVRQQQVNRTLLSSVEVLALEVVRLRRDLERARSEVAPATPPQGTQ